MTVEKTVDRRPQRKTRGRLSTPEALACFSVALLIRVAFAALHDFDGAYGQDAWAYIERAFRLRATGFALQPFDPGYTLPVLFAFMIASMMAVVGPVVGAGQAVAIVAGSLTAPIMAALTRALFPRAHRSAAWIAAGLVAFSGQHVTWSIAAMSDAPAALFVAVSMLALARAQRPETFGRWMVLAGLALGVAWSTRWSYVAVAPAFAAAWIIAARAVNALAPGHYRRAGLAVLAGIVACLPQLIITLRHPKGLGIGWSGDWSPLNFVVRSFYFAEGQYDYTLPMGVYYALPAIHPGWMSPVVGLCGIWGLHSVWKKRAMVRDQVALALCAGGAACSWLMLAGMPHQNFRYGMQIWLPLVPLVALGVSRIGKLTAGKRRLALVGVGLSCCVLLVWTVRSPAQLVAIAHGHRDAALALTKDLPADARIWALGPTATLQNRTARDVVELFRRKPSDVANALASPRPLYTLFDPAAAARWRHGDLPRTLAALQRSRVDDIAVNPPWTLRRYTPPRSNR